jgi:threonine/homoserine/homoserine lactone efflux protein
MTAFGIAVVLRRWPSVWAAVRIGGVAYLGWLGYQSLRRGFSGRFTSSSVAGDGRPRATVRNLYEGVVTNLLNPALGTFYIVVVPQFVPPSVPATRGVLTLAALHISIALTWHMVWAVAGGTMASALSKGRPRQALELTAGVALLALAVRMAVNP